MARRRSGPGYAVLAAALLAGAAVSANSGPVPNAAEEHRLAGARIEATAALRLTETDAAALAAELDALQARARAADAEVARRSSALQPLLPLVQRLALHPAETLLTVPGPPDRAMLGLQVLHGMARRLQIEAAALRAEAADAAAAAAAIRAALDKLAGVQSRQAAQAAALDRQIEASRAGRQQAEDAAAEQARRAAVEAAQAESLRAALAGIEAERARAEARAAADIGRAERARQDATAAEARQRRQALARPAGPGLALPGTVAPAASSPAAAPGAAAGPLFVPAAGQVVRGWGEHTDVGAATGLTLRPPPAARVAAPCSGRAAFAGPFRSYGVLLILDCGGGYHVVLAGFERLDVAVGTAVQRGEPVGVMPGWDPRVAGPRPGLYMELRHGGQPVDPTPFLRGRG